MVLSLVRVADLPGRHSLRSAQTSRLLVSAVKLPTVGGRAFPVAGPTIWNSLPDNVISAPSENLSLPGQVQWRYRRSPLNYSTTFSGS